MIAASLAACLTGARPVTAAQAERQKSDRETLIAELDSLIATGHPHHASHDQGERMQLWVDEAIARGDREVERLAIRASSPFTASVSAPVSSTQDLPAFSVGSWNLLRVPHPARYSARVFVSIDGGEFTFLRVFRQGKGEGGRMDRMLPEAASRPGFHVIQVKADLTFEPEQRGRKAWSEERMLPPLFYAIYDPAAASGASIRALVHGPASMPARAFDPALGDEPFAAWLSGVLMQRRTARDGPPGWISQYCHEREGEAGVRTPANAVCSVASFQTRGEIGQIWFRTADVRENERGAEWIPVSPPRLEGIVLLPSGSESASLSALPSLMDTALESRPAGDISIAPADIVYSPAVPPAGTPVDVTMTFRNSGEAALHKAVVNVMWGVDPAVRGTSRQFVVDIPAQGSAELQVRVQFPGGYGFVMGMGSQISEHSPFGYWTPDPTPDDACAIRVVNPRVAPPNYLQHVAEAVGPGCAVK